VEILFAPQLPLEAAIAEQGGFGELGERSVQAIRYIKASGRDHGGEESPAGTSAPASLASKALKDLIALVERYDRPDMPYEVKRRSVFRRLYDYDDYAHLARVDEWLTQEAEEEWR
jgi:ATP-dependent helicase/nuclease subunit B